MDRSTDQIERDLARTRRDLERTVTEIQQEARTRVRRFGSGALLAAGVAAAALLIVGAVRRLRVR